MIRVFAISLTAVFLLLATIPVSAQSQPLGTGVIQRGLVAKDANASRNDASSRVARAKQRRVALYDRLPEATKRRIRSAELKAARRLTEEQTQGIEQPARSEARTQKSTSTTTRAGRPRGNAGSTPFVATGRVRPVAHFDQLMETAPLDPEVVFSDGPMSGGLCCGPSCGPHCNACVSPWGVPYSQGRFKVRGEYLLWATDGMDTPVLATTDPSGVNPASVVFGGGGLNDELRSGGRITFSYLPLHWCGWSMDLEYTALGKESEDFYAYSNGGLFRPYFDLETLQADVAVVNCELSMTANTELHGLDIVGRKMICRDCNHRFDFLVGYRYGRLKDDVLINESLNPTAGVTAGSQIQRSDHFGTTNTFHGAVLGVSAEAQHQCWHLNLLMKLGIGGIRSEAFIHGATSVTDVNDDVSSYEGGLLALPSNIGSYTRDQFGMVPELGVTLSRSFARHWRASIGYSLVYWSQVVRAGDQIDLDLNLSQLPPGPLVGTARPNFSFVSTDLLAQGLRFGLECEF